MAWLKVYSWEAETWPDFRSIRLSNDEARKLLKKFSRHFKTPVPILHLWRKHWGGTYHSLGYYMNISRPVALCVLIHEYAHHLNYIRNDKHGHGRQFRRELKRVYTWAKRYLIPGLDALRRI